MATHKIYIDRKMVFKEGVTWTTVPGLYPDAYVPEAALAEAQAEIDRLTAEVERLTKDQRRIITERDATFALVLARAEKVEATNETWRQNSIDTWSAMNAMRNAINEHVPMPSLESDLLQGPENSIFCETVSRAVIEHVMRLIAERDTIAADAFEAAARVMDAQATYWDSLSNDWEKADAENHSKAIRALTTADALAAREARDRASEAKGMREAAEIVGKLALDRDAGGTPTARAQGASLAVANNAILARARARAAESDAFREHLKAGGTVSSFHEGKP